ncbi:putative toxin-antitoxin system toxin component, PIN family [Candidatus Curtissbacteria bacterium RIFCSPHIGHO2_01_FULL_41_11]|uniref:Putative toxin-antitoxin system toxin component, PIN family n=1 Tax=Candidatus Curtissbacteria bacterium RIFCSPHIGHO2_01_FULL_41_11 TaxID=1797711 RepID=A0A1F5G446_9BACT|nr:MAG: putative toxin-antitoxin system toxin component, PIN family [Candidatus Curtissbacteria bacterium RIFCSPHIGHO2_01_FULL_41_11]
MPRVVNDTNVWLSALYFSGKPAKIVNLIEDQKIVSITSDFILEEVKEKLVSSFNTPLYAANGTVSYISSISQIVPLAGKDFNLRDPDDNKVLETAVVGKCDFLITGDKDLLTLGGYNRIQIVAPAEFLDKFK